MTTKPTDKAVDALSRAARLSFDDGIFSPYECISALSEEGFTITRAEPAMSEKALLAIREYTHPMVKFDCENTIRAHIAALEHRHDDLVTRCVQAEAEVERLRVALNTCEGRILNAQIGINTGDTKAGLSKYLDAVLSIIRKALNPEQKGGV